MAKGKLKSDSDTESEALSIHCEVEIFDVK
jgi:hypothetical protein